MKKYRIYLIASILLSISVTTVSASEPETQFNNEITSDFIGTEDNIDIEGADVLAETDEWMPDGNLQHAISQKLNIEVADLSKEKMELLTSLELNSSENIISNLSGLEYAVNLVDLKIGLATNITDYTPITLLEQLDYLALTTPNLNDGNFPNLPQSISILDLRETRITDESLNIVGHIENLEYLYIDRLKTIKSIDPLVHAKKLRLIFMQFSGVHDFRIVNEMPALRELLAYSPNVGDDNSISTLYHEELINDEINKVVFIPFSIMPDRLTNFDGYQPPFTKSTSANNTVLKINGDQIPSSRMTIDEHGITVSGFDVLDFESITSLYYNARFDNPAGSYKTPEHLINYAISSGIYLHQFDVIPAPSFGEIIIKYTDEMGNELVPTIRNEGLIGEAFIAAPIEIDGWKLQPGQTKIEMQFEKDIQTQSFIYIENSINPLIPQEVIPEGPNDDTKIPTESENQSLGNLPNTGFSNSDLAIYWGGFLLVGIGIYLVIRKEYSK